MFPLTLCLDVLVAPKRLVKRFAGLTQEEITDLFINSQRVCATVERAYNATSCTIAIQVYAHTLFGTVYSVLVLTIKVSVRMVMMLVKQ